MNSAKDRPQGNDLHGWAGVINHSSLHCPSPIPIPLIARPTGPILQRCTIVQIWTNTDKCREQFRHFTETGRWAAALGRRVLPTPFSSIYPCYRPLFQKSRYSANYEVRRVCIVHSLTLPTRGRLRLFNRCRSPAQGIPGRG